MNEIRTEGSLPLELQTSTPRAVRLTVAGMAASLAALACLAGALFVAVWLSREAGRDAVRRQQFEREGVAVEAQVVSVGKMQGESRRRRVSYRYMAVGKLWDGRKTLDRSEWRGLEPGSPITVHYLPSDPGTSYAGRDPGGTPYWVVPLLSLTLIGVAGLIGAGIRRQRNLLMEGRAAVARIVSTRRVGRHKRNSRVAVEFNALSGGRVEASYDERGPAPQPGSEVIILYDREKQTRVARFPMCMVKLDAR